MKINIIYRRKKKKRKSKQYKLIFRGNISDSARFDNRIVDKQLLQQKTSDIPSETSTKRKAKKKYDLTQLKPIGLKILVDLVNYISQNPNTDLFGDNVFIQEIKTKKKHQEIEIIKSEDFFEGLELYGIMNNPINPFHKKELEEAKESIGKLLYLDAQYENYLVIKKINSVVNQINNDEEIKLKAKNISFTPLHELSPTPLKEKEESDSDKVDEEYEEEFIDDDIEANDKNKKGLESNSKSPQNLKESVDHYDEPFEEGMEK